jgi:hypothetical protein
MSLISPPIQILDILLSIHWILKMGWVSLHKIFLHPSHKIKAQLSHIKLQVCEAIAKRKEQNITNFFSKIIGHMMEWALKSILAYYLNMYNIELTNTPVPINNQ